VAQDGAARNDPDFLQASAWLSRTPGDPDAVVLGAPFAGGSISRARCDLAPAAVRQALQKFSVWYGDAQVSLEHLGVLDAGDVEPDDDVAKTQLRVEEAVASHAARPVVVLGGDNSITVGAARGVRADALLTFDAHHDCRDPARGPSNGTVVRQLVDGGLARVAQIGIHGFANTEPHARWAGDHGVRWFPASEVRSVGIDAVVRHALGTFRAARRIWVDVDLDCLERALAPGAPAAMPGGLYPADLERAAYLVGREPRVAGLDIVECDPQADVAQATVRTACAVMLAFLAGVASR
jgi:formiminoglutamase